MEVRPTYVSRFVENASTIKKRMLGNIPDIWRKEDGDFIVDAISADPAEIIQLEMNQDRVLQNAFPQFCDDEFMDAHMKLRGISRLQATYSKRDLLIKATVGVRIPKGYPLTSVVLDGDGNPIEFTMNDETVFTEVKTTLTVSVTCKLVGTVGNLATGAEFVLQPPIPGVESITDVGITVPAADKEGLDEAWTRLLFKAQNPDTGGNKSDYRRWVLNEFPIVSGAAVGKCAVVPRAFGNGTVKIVLVGPDYRTATPTLVDMVQDYLDPLDKQGEGAGKAPAGASVTVFAANETLVSISATVALNKAATLDTVKETFTAVVTEYMQRITFEENPATGTLSTVAYNIVGALLIGLDGVDNYANLLLNGDTSDVSLEGYAVPVLEGVTLS